MGEPVGNIAVICALQSDGTIRALEITDSDELKVALASAGVGLVSEHGWYSSAWQKQPITLGYSFDKTETVDDLDATTGAHSLEGTTVPAGEIWILQAVHAVDLDNPPASIAFRAQVNGIDVYISPLYAPAAGERVVWTGSLVLSEGDRIEAIFTGVTLHDRIQMRYHAVRVDIDQ